MIDIREAIKNALIPFEDDRHFCTECGYYKEGAWKGLCKAQLVQYGKVKNRCDTFVGKLVKKEQLTEEAFWE